MQMVKATGRPLLRWLGLSMLVSLVVTLLAATPALAHAYFEVTTEGEPPENATFWGMYGPPNSEFSAVQLTDPDGDGVYAGGVTVEPDNYVTQIVQGTGVQDTVYGPFPGEPSTVLRDFGTIWLDNDTVLRASVSFDGEQPDEEQPRCFLPEGCSISGDGSSETLVGGAGPDYIVGGGGGDALHGLGGGDWLDGGAGDDLVRGNEGDDLVDGGSGNDLVRGDDGNDYVTGFTGNDILQGDAGSDFIYAADGEFDEVSGGPGYDVCVVDEDDDVSGCEEVTTQ